MGVFTKRSTPNDCIERISNAMNEVMVIRDILDATPKGKDYKADWDADRKYAHEHLSEAWGSLGAALSGLMTSQRQPTRDKQADATVETQRRHLIALRAEVKRLQGALALAEAHAAGIEMATAQHTLPQGGEELALRVQRAVMGAVHPDRAADAAEEEWRTRLCQTLFPEIDLIMRNF